MRALRAFGYEIEIDKESRQGLFWTFTAISGFIFLATTPLWLFPILGWVR